MQTIMNFHSPKDAMEWATIIAKSKFCPKEFFNHPESVLVAIAYGAELGLKPLQALQNICVINGKPSIYGDAMLAVCKNSPDFEYIKEDVRNLLESIPDDMHATCVVKRREQPECFYSFSKKDAIEAGLWNRPGPWKQYPKRMLQMRARSFALRDCFPDVLKGMIAVEEAQDYKIEKDVTVIKPNIEERKAYLNYLIEKNHIEDKVVFQWIDKAQVNTSDEFPPEIVEKLITHLEKMEEPNGEN